MNRPREQLLPGARIAIDQHARVGVGDEPGLPQQVLHLRTARDDAFAPCSRFAVADRDVIAGQFEGGGNFLKEILAVERLREEGEYAALCRVDGIGNRAVRGENDDRHRRMLPMDRLEQLQPVDARHPHVGNYRSRTSDRECRQRCLAAVRRANAIASRHEPEADQPEQIRIVVDEQNVAGVHGRYSIASASTSAGPAAAAATATATHAIAHQAPFHLTQRFKLLDHLVGLLLFVVDGFLSLGHLRLQHRCKLLDRRRSGVTFRHVFE